MATGWRYRIASILGTAVLTAATVAVANHPAVQTAFALVPYFGRPAPSVLTNGALAVAVWTTLLVVLGSMWPVFKPRPRRLLDTLLLTQKRVLLAMVGLAALGYFNYTYRLPRSTLLLTTAFLLVALPLWTIRIRRRPRTSSRAIVVGDDPDAMAATLRATDLPILGYVSPPVFQKLAAGERARVPERSDGGTARITELSGFDRLGGLSRLEEILVERDVDAALLAFSQTDRAEFFGALATCYKHGVTAKVHREHADSVLTTEVAGEDLVEVNLEPWDWQDHVVKRGFDVAFALGGLLVLSPIVLVIAVAIKLDSPGPILYNHQRTAEFGETFTVYKFRSMVPDAESTTGATLSAEDGGGTDPRVTRVGRFLRRTHLDEIPQLWSILRGDMSVVGPRPERPELDDDIQAAIDDWQRRWFVRPGLTGLAQIRGATGYEPEQKLRYDIEYIRRQSFWFDLKIVIRQLYQVVIDALAAIGRSEDEPG